MAVRAGKRTWVKADFPKGTSLGSLADGSQWVPVGTNGKDKDWAQIGAHADHYPGKSHKEDAGGYPKWGDDASLAEESIWLVTVDNFNLENLRRKTWR